MDKYIQIAKKYSDSRGFDYPVNFEKLNNESLFVIFGASLAEIISGLLIGWVANLVFFHWLNLNQFIKIDKTSFIWIFCLYFALAFVIGGVRIYRNKWSMSLTKNELLFFLSRIFEFNDKFSKGLFFLTFTYNFFGV